MCWLVDLRFSVDVVNGQARLSIDLPNKSACATVGMAMVPD